MTAGGTPYCADTFLSTAAWRLAISRAVLTVFRSTRRFRYWSIVSVRSGCVWSRSTTTGSGSRPVSAASTVRSLIPLASASLRRSASQSANGTVGGAAASCADAIVGTTAVAQTSASRTMNRLRRLGITVATLSAGSRCDATGLRAELALRLTPYASRPALESQARTGSAQRANL